MTLINDSTALTEHVEKSALDLTAGLDGLRADVARQAEGTALAVRELRVSAEKERAEALAKQHEEFVDELAVQRAAAAAQGESVGRTTAFSALSALGAGIKGLSIEEGALLIDDSLSYRTLPTGYPHLELAPAALS